MVSTASENAAPPPEVAVVAVTVVIITYGALDQLDRSLDALVRQDLQAAYDIIVVDNAPASATARMVALWAARSASAHAHGGRQSAQLRYLPHESHPGDEAAARNVGWRSARSSIIAFTGDDTVAAPDWLRQGLAAFDSITLDAALPEAVFGHVDTPLPRHPTEFQVKAHLRESGEFAGCNWFATRSLLERLQGFDERFDDAIGIDTDMHFRLLEANVRLRAAPAARVAHPLPPLNWGASLAQLRALSGDALLYKKHPQLYRQKIRQPPDWHDVAVVASLVLAICGLWLGHELLAVTAGGIWLVLTAMLCIRRLRDTAKTPSHVAAVVVTSLFIPPLALFWRLVGAVRHRVRYA